MNLKYFLVIFLFLNPILAWPYQNIEPSELKDQIKRTIPKIPEFVKIVEEAKKRGLDIWLFGGTASSFAHYVKDSILFKRGIDEYYSEHFQEDPKGNLDYTDIFRPTQDMDIVADGDLKEIEEFAKHISSLYPHLKGSKRRWEVRPLREGHRDKQALLHNPDFLNQNTDSHSVGLISLNPNVSIGEVVRDLYDWDALYPSFLQDVLAGELHYYYNPQHKTTSRYIEGKNPEIFSVIRYYIKLFQHRLSPALEDSENIRRVIQETDWKEIQPEGYIAHWLRENVPKLFLHAQDVEYAANVLEDSGLKEKLLQMGKIDQVGEPAWWANKEPLRSFEVGKGDGKSAKELEIETVAHDTKDFFLWTVITRSRKGEPNVLISRKDIAGENAIHGPGFYTVKNNRRGIGNGFSIRFKVHPQAREGSDFRTEGNYVIITNKNAISVIPESIKISGLLEYFELIKEGIGERRQRSTRKAQAQNRKSLF